jgi:hypothetical protein
LSDILACPELAVDADGTSPKVSALEPCLPWVLSFLGVFMAEVDVAEAALRLLCAAATPWAARGLIPASHLLSFALGVHRGQPRVVAHGMALLAVLANPGSPKLPICWSGCRWCCPSFSGTESAWMSLAVVWSC